MFQKGHINSKEVREKMSKSHKGKVGYWKGKKRSAELKEKMRLANLREKSHFWKGGKSFEKYTVDWNETLKRSIRERDRYTCQLCGGYGNLVHHKDENKKNCNPSNLITLCIHCHIWLHNKNFKLSMKGAQKGPK